MLTSRPSRARGLTLIEILVAVAIVGILARVGMPTFTTWVRNAQVTAAGESLAMALRHAQAESIRRAHQVVFTTTAGTPGPTSPANAGGTNWALHAVPRAGETLEFIKGGSLREGGEGAQISGPSALCSNSIGRRTANASPGVSGATCTLTTTNAVAQYDVTVSGAQKTMRISVTINGQVSAYAITTP